MSDTTMSKAKGAVADAIESTREKVSDGLDAARERFEETAEEIEDRVRRGKVEFRAKAERARDAAKEKYEAAMAGLQKGYSKVRKDASDLTDDVNEYVRENPGKSILIAAGVGFVIGLLVRGRRKEDY